MSGDLVSWAQETAAHHMQPLGRRWLHVQAVGALAEQIAPAYGVDHELLVASAYLHDIGYSAELATTGFHPLDGARRLVELGHDDLASFVAHHSGARREARLRGLDQFESEFPWNPHPLHAAVTFCDLTTSPDGEPVPLADRIAEIVDRYGPDHVTARAIVASQREFEGFADDVRTRVADVGIELDPQRMAGSELVR